jgi:hypothetical protein
MKILHLTLWLDEQTGAKENTGALRARGVRRATHDRHVLAASSMPPSSEQAA